MKRMQMNWKKRNKGTRISRKNMKMKEITC